MVVNDFEDDYKSDECDEHTATELFYKACFNEQSIFVSCEEYIESRKSFTEPEVNEPKEIRVETAKITLCLDKPKGVVEPVAVITLAETKKEESEKPLSILKPDRDESDGEGIATKLEPRNISDAKSTKKTRKSSSKPSSPTDSPLRSKPDDDNEDSDDINANIKPKRRKVKAPLASKLNNNQRKQANVKSMRGSQTPSQPVKVVNDKVVHQTDEDSTELPTLTPELSSDDEISLSDPEGIELNVVSFGRGIPDKVTMRKKVSPEEHKRLWHVDIDDKYRHLRRSRYHTSKECRNCRQSGHMTHECPLPEKIVCILCADTTHLAARCPDKICSICKNEGHTAWRCFRMQQLIETKCRICNIFGHRADICPDNWRRYHCTTVEGPPIAPECEEKLPHERKFCSWCGRQGHFAFECKKAGNSGIASRFVHSYGEPSSKPPRTVVKRKSKKEKAAKRQEQTSQAEQGRAAVFGSDFVPLASVSKMFQGGGISSNNSSKKNKRTNQSFVARVEERIESKRKRKFEADYGGIEMLPSVQKRKRRNEAESSDTKPRNRRKERRKLQRMQNRNERDKVKKKKSKS